jgi:hypothetical protein
MDGARPSAIRSGGSLRIRRARLHNAAPGDRDRLALRLDSIRPSTVGIPDRALLIVPRLVARRPLPRHGDSGLFAGAVADGLRAALRRARRPGEARSSDDSLLFLDELDAAAWLIEQWLAGAAPAERLWWPHVTDGAEPPVWWRREILPDGRRLPSLIARLVRRGIAEPWLARLDPSDLRAGLAAIAETHGLSLPPVRDAPAPARRSRSDRAIAPDVAPAAAIVEAIAPEARRSDLPPPARLLLLVGLVAERRPAMLAARSAALAFAAVASGRLSRAGTIAGPAPPTAPASPPSQRVHRAGPAPAGSFDPEPSPAQLPPMAPAPEEEVATPRSGSDPPARRSAAAGSTERPERSVRARPIEAAVPSAAIRSEFGGLLFLLNALLALGVYGDFTEPRRSVPGLSPFGLLRLLGRAWFGAGFVADPLHGLLVRLAGGRLADSPGDFESRRWSVPSAWLRPWPDPGPPLVGGSRRRPMLWHPAGFPLAELDGAGPGAASRAARKSGLKGVPRRARLPALPGPPRARWLACLRLYLEARLPEALGCSDGIAAAALLCRHPAFISVDGDRVDARFALDDHPLAIRLAGLDRDPGWIPAARYDLQYFFE